MVENEPLKIEILDEGMNPDGTAAQTAVIDRPRSRWPFLVAVAGIVAGAGFLAYSVLTRGQDLTPTEAATEMVDALTAGDLLGAVAVLPPSEREALAGPALSIIDELQRLDITPAAIDGGDDGDDAGGDDGDDAGTGSGLAVTINEPVFTVVQETEDLVIVAVDHLGGSGPTDIVETLIGPLLDQLDEDVDAGSETFEAGRFHLATVEEDGGWYVSPVHTWLEYGRTVEGTSFPLEPHVRVPGSASAEAVLQDLADKLTSGDFVGALNLLDPAEAEGFQRYAPSIFDMDAEGENFRDSLVRDDVTLDVTIGSSLDEDNRGPFVRVDEFDLLVEFGEDARFEYRGSDGCVEMIFDDLWDDEEPTEITQCTNGPAAVDGEEVPGFTLPDGLRPPLFDAYDGGTPTFGGIRVTEIDGTWYLSPWQTGWAWVEDLLRPLDATDISDTIDWFRDLQDDPERADQLLTELFENNDLAENNPIFGSTFSDPEFEDPAFSPGESLTEYISADVLPPSSYSWPMSPDAASDLLIADAAAIATPIGGHETEVMSSRGYAAPDSDSGSVFYLAVQFDSPEDAAAAFANAATPPDVYGLMPVDGFDDPDAHVFVDDWGVSFALFTSGDVVYQIVAYAERPTQAIDNAVAHLESLRAWVAGIS